MKQVLDTAGLALGILGVSIIFKYGPPQPVLEKGVGLEVEAGTPIDGSGKTAAEYDSEVGRRRMVYSVVSKIGLFCIGAGFACQLLGVWAE